MATLGPGGADWDEIFAGDGSDTEPYDHQLLANCMDLPPGRALDLGCGPGGNAIELARRGWAVTGVDSSSHAIGSARISAQAAQVQVRFLVADMRIWKPDGLYDLVVNWFALPPRGADRQNVLTVAKQALAPGGLLVVGEWETMDSRSHPYLTVAEMTAALHDLQVTRAETINADPEPGPSGQGRRSWPAVMVAARRRL